MLSYLTQNKVPYALVLNYCEESVKTCLELGLGLGPFRPGRDIDVDYLKQRSEILKSHNSLYT